LLQILIFPPIYYYFSGGRALNLFVKRLLTNSEVMNFKPYIYFENTERVFWVWFFYLKDLVVGAKHNIRINLSFDGFPKMAKLVFWFFGVM